MTNEKIEVSIKDIPLVIEKLNEANNKIQVLIEKNEKLEAVNNELSKELHEARHTKYEKYVVPEIENKNQEINKLTAESTEWESKYYDMQDNFRNANEEIERLNKGVEKYKKRCYEALTLIRENYGLLDKYGIDMLDDILNGSDKE